MPHAELHERRKMKNRAMMAAVGGFALLVFVVTILKMAVHS